MNPTEGLFRDKLDTPRYTVVVRRFFNKTISLAFWAFYLVFSVKLLIVRKGNGLFL
jgi:hypothetical protein